jgi:hypothetical protein
MAQDQDLRELHKEDDFVPFSCLFLIDCHPLIILPSSANAIAPAAGHRLRRRRAQTDRTADARAPPPERRRRILYRITFGRPQRRHPLPRCHQHPQQLLPHHQLSTLEKPSSIVERLNLCVTKKTTTSMSPASPTRSRTFFSLLVTLHPSTVSHSSAILEGSTLSSVGDYNMTSPRPPPPSPPAPASPASPPPAP